METKETVLFHLQHLRQLVFEVTDLCNLNCNYCGLSQLYEGYDIRNNKMLSLNQAKTLIDYVFKIRDKAAGVTYPLNISFYGGEPLLNMNLIEQVVDYLSQEQLQKVTLGMTTNGLLLDKYMDFLAKHKFQLVISLDGDETGHSYRVDYAGHNSFQRVFKNIRQLQGRYPDYFEKYVLFNAVLHNRNSVEATYHFIKKNFKKVPQIVPLNAAGIREDKVDEFRAMYQNVNESLIKSGNCEAIEAEMFIHAPRVMDLTQFIFKQSGNVFGDFNDLIFDISSSKKQWTGTCSPFAKKMFVTVHGKILQCERISHHFELGQILEDRVELDAEKIANKQNEYITKIKSQCEKCYLNEECPQCVYNIDNISNASPRCINFCNKNRYQQAQQSTGNYLREHRHYYEKILNEVTVTY